MSLVIVLLCIPESHMSYIFFLWVVWGICEIWPWQQFFLPCKSGIFESVLWAPLVRRAFDGWVDCSLMEEERAGGREGIRRE